MGRGGGVGEIVSGVSTERSAVLGEVQRRWKKEKLDRPEDKSDVVCFAYG